MWGLKECSSCWALYTKSCGCSKGGFIDKCGSPVDGLCCRYYALLWKKLKEVWFTICDEHKFFQDFLNTSKSSNDDSNVVNIPQEPIILNQDPGENSSQSPPQIDHHCCYGCGNSLDEPCHDKNVEEFPQTLPSSHPTWYSGDENSFTYYSTPNLVKDYPNVFNPPSQPLMYSYEFYGDDAHYSYDCPPQKIPLCYDNDDDDESSVPLRDIIISELPPCIAITPIVSTKDSLIMGDEHLNTIPERESDEFIKSSVEDLIPNQSESEDEQEFISENSDAVIESFSPSPIPIEDSDSLRDEIDLSLTPDDSMPPGIEDDDYDSEGDILKELLSNDSLSLPENESFHFDIPSSPRPPVKPPDDEIEPNSGILTVKVVGDISEHYVLVLDFCPPKPPLLQIRRNLLISYLIGALKLFNFLLKAR
nr:hypothetical protein [Tanacetum cinerariifolium]